MSIATEVSRLQAAKTNIKNSIENKGVTVPPSATLDLYPGYIDQISTGIQPDSIILDIKPVAVGYTVPVAIYPAFNGVRVDQDISASVSLSSSDTNVATVGTGTVTGVTVGSTTITASLGSISATATISCVASDSISAVYSKVKAGTVALGERVTDTVSNTTWRVVHLMEDSSTYGGIGRGAILQMTHYVDEENKAFANTAGTQYTEWRGMDSITALQSNAYLRYYMNNGFYNTLSADFRAIIATASVPTCPNGDAAIYRTSDKLFAASAYEMMGVGSGARYLEGEQWGYWKGLIPTASNDSNANRIMYNNTGGSSGKWWLRSALQGDAGSMLTVFSNGTIGSGAVTSTNRVVPACLIA